ncbi:AsmA protein [Bryocella elongata]|uniref:AsmA protein n=1 Tax=Bryocella elongata TaxID=863522 RepID=A0A1H6BRC7_9BACT|nr:AsmA family protein [Bryocella elongata]SEG63182.1 AsmA protein [Bryocella elongata]
MSAWGSIDPVLDEDLARGMRPRRWHWLVLLGILVLLGLLILTPPMLNVNRYQRRIAASISASLGRPVHLDRVSLHLLPMPGFTLENLVVSEDPHFGFEPIIRANVVEATLRPSSLWRRQVEFSTIRFVEPSLNLVRDADGKWNLESLLMHASQLDTAPTSQPKAGTSPRFPYIEATGARVNLKVGAEKMPFSLTDADFALWLPSAQQWRIRLDAKPARTDTNISDPGMLRVEGSLQRAPTLAGVPVDLQLTWRDAPLGEASRIVTGQDAEWRGTLHIDVAVAGGLGHATVRAHATVNDLRRADFLPANPLDLSIRCDGTLNITDAGLENAACGVATPQAHGFDQPGAVEAKAAKLDILGLRGSGLAVTMTHVPDNYLLEWAKLFSRRMQAIHAPEGAISATGEWIPAENGQPGWWKGEAHGELPPASVADPRLAAPTIAGTPQGFALGAINVAAEGKPALNLSGLATQGSYSFTLTGSATPQEIRDYIAMAPPLGDNLDQTWAPLAPAKPDAKASDAKSADTKAAKDEPAKAVPINITCGRPWGGPQTCVATAPPATGKAKGKHKR